MTIFPASFTGSTDANLIYIKDIEIVLRLDAPVTAETGNWSHVRETSFNGIRWFLTYDGKEVNTTPTTSEARAFAANVLRAIRFEMHEEMYLLPHPDSIVPVEEPKITYEQLESTNEKLAHRVLMRNAQLEELAAENKKLRKALDAEIREHNATKKRLAQTRTRLSQAS